MNSVLISLYMFFFILLFIFLLHVGVQDLAYNTYLFSKFVESDQILYNNTVTLSIINNQKVYHKIIDINLPTLFIIGIHHSKSRMLKLCELNYNVIQIISKSLINRPSSMREKYLKTYETIIKELEIKDPHIYCLCNCTDLGLYIADRTPNLTKSIILDIPIDDFGSIIDDIFNINVIKYFVKDICTFNYKFIINQNVLILTHINEPYNSIKNMLTKSNKIKNDKNKIVFYIFNDINNKHGHGGTYEHNQFLNVIQKWIDVGYNLDSFS